MHKVVRCTSRLLLITFGILCIQYSEAQVYEFGQISNASNYPDPDNETPDESEVVSLTLPEGIFGRFNNTNDTDYWILNNTASATIRFEPIILDANVSVTLESYTILTGTPNQTPVSLLNGQEFTLTGGPIFVLKVERAGGSGNDPYSFAIAAGNGTNGDALPVEWLRYEVRSLSSGIELTWSTASEENNQGFYVERSLDAQTWESLDFVEGAGTTQEIQSYSYMDRLPNIGYTYYRLKQIDYNGDFAYSDIREIVLGLEDFSQPVQVFPNPALDRITISPFIGQISLLDLTGRVILKEKQNGVWKEQNLSGIPAGVYILHIQPVSGESIPIYLSKY